MYLNIYNYSVYNFKDIIRCTENNLIFFAHVIIMYENWIVIGHGIMLICIIKPGLRIRVFWSDPDPVYKIRSDPDSVFKTSSDTDPVFKIRSDLDPDFCFGSLPGSVTLVILFLCVKLYCYFDYCKALVYGVEKSKIVDYIDDFFLHKNM